MLAVEGEHDRDRIGARKMLRLALRAVAPPAALRHVGRRAAIGAEAMTRMPVQQRLGLRERRQMIDRDQTLHRDRAQIGDEKVLARFQAFGEFRIEPDAEPGGVALQTEEQRLHVVCERADFGNEKTGSSPLLVFFSTIHSPPTT